MTKQCTDAGRTRRFLRLRTVHRADIEGTKGLETETAGYRADQTIDWCEQAVIDCCIYTASFGVTLQVDRTGRLEQQNCTVTATAAAQ
jgi:hypothetical protein